MEVVIFLLLLKTVHFRNVDRLLIIVFFSFISVDIHKLAGVFVVVTSCKGFYWVHNCDISIYTIVKKKLKN